MQTVQSNVQVIYFSTDPFTAILNAQVVILTKLSWYIHGPHYASGDPSFVPMPPVNCPVVNISALPSSMDAEVYAVLKAHEKGSGYKNLPAMLIELEKLGAAVSYPIGYRDVPELITYLESAGLK